MDFSERIAACDLKAGRCSQLNEASRISKVSVYTKYSGERLRTNGPLVMFWFNESNLYRYLTARAVSSSLWRLLGEAKT